MGAYGSDWADNPTTQIQWGLAYIGGSYGTPCGAWSEFRVPGLVLTGDPASGVGHAASTSRRLVELLLGELRPARRTGSTTTSRIVRRCANDCLATFAAAS